jgi:hypothetical protein
MPSASSSVTVSDADAPLRKTTTDARDRSVSSPSTFSRPI